jgi:hypothetical protein
MHTTGTYGRHDRKITAVLALEPVGTAWDVARVTAVTKTVNLAEQFLND